MNWWQTGLVVVGLVVLARVIARTMREIWEQGAE